MKPPVFEYVRAGTVDEALVTLASDSDAKIIAGGQSLVPLLNLRLAQPSRLVDVNRIAGLNGVTRDGEGGLRLGALLRHTRLLSDPTVAQTMPLLRHAAQFIGHVAIRNRGTLGGSLAHADPTAELCAAAVALGALLRLRSRDAERTVPAEAFFEAAYVTRMREEEMLVEIVLPPRPLGEGAAYAEMAIRQGDFAIVGVAALARRDRQGALSGVRVVFSGMGGVPVLASELGADLEGVLAGDPRVEEAVDAAAGALEPVSDVRGSAEYRRHLACVLATSAIRSAAAASADDEAG